MDFGGNGRNCHVGGSKQKFKHWNEKMLKSNLRNWGNYESVKVYFWEGVGYWSIYFPSRLLPSGMEKRPLTFRIFGVIDET